MSIELGRITDAYRELALRADRIVVGGAGGAFSPPDHDHAMLDLAPTIGWPVLPGRGGRRGCLNHALPPGAASRLPGRA